MGQKTIALYVVVLLLVLGGLMSSKPKDSTNTIVAQAIKLDLVEQQKVVKDYNKLEIKEGRDTYYLDVVKVNKDRTEADFVFMSDTNDIRIPFTLDRVNRIVSRERTGERSVTAQDTKVIAISDDKAFYIKLVNIEAGNAIIELKKVMK